jgi:hypothetical protein
MMEKPVWKTPQLGVHFVAERQVSTLRGIDASAGTPG